MGFLQHDTNNIVIDCVLTDSGRKFLARNDGSFSIVKFGCADDEVNYNIIKQFGRTIGKEKIEKNTPIFEALTNQNQALKYKLVSVSNPNLVRLPSLSLSGEGLTNNILSLGARITRRRTITVSQTIQNESSIDVDLRDPGFIIEANNLFVQVEGDQPDNIAANNMATYLVSRDATTTSAGGAQLTLTLSTKSIPDSLFTTYGNTSNKNVIRTFVRISGLASGAVLDMEVQISKTS